MDLIVTISSVFCFLYCLLNLSYAITLRFYNNPKKKYTENISILVAARNEESNIENLISSLSELNYPQNKLEILIGDDSSEDNTRDIILKSIQGKNQFKLINIKPSDGNLRGKQNVLAQLARISSGNILLIVDADITVKPEWAACLCGGFENNVGIVSGTTIVEGKSLFFKFQKLDWLYWMSVANAHAYWKLPITCVGNNMAVLRKAYLETGGYENIEFSITEDYKLFKEVVEKKGYDFKVLFSRDCLNISAPVVNYFDLLHQRKRWLIGIKELPLHHLVLLFLNGMFLPSILYLLCFYSIKTALFWYALKIICDFIVMLSSLDKIKQIKEIIYFPFFEILYQVMAIVLPFFTFSPIKVNWKNRLY